MRSCALVACVVLGVGACRGGSAPEVRPAAGPALAVATEPPALLEVPDAGGAASVAELEEGMPKLSVVLDDPRLATAKQRVRDSDPSGAAKAMEAALATATLDATQACTWAYAAGRLHGESSETAEAEAAFERALAANGDAGPPCALAPYANLRAAEALLALGRHDDAVARLQAAGEDFALRDEARLAMADALMLKNDRPSAVPIWRTLLASAPHGVRWPDTSVRLASALLDGVEGPPVGHAREAFDLTTRVLVEAPMAVEKLDVVGPRARAAKLLHGASTLLAPDERARQAQAWLDAAQPKRATEVADALLKALPRGDKKHHEAACKAAIVRAQAVPRAKSEDAAEAWGDAIARCDGEDAQVTALYYGGKASVSAHRHVEATSRFALVESRFPKHRLADDARFHAALVVYDEGDEAKSLAMLASIPDAYPDGDMKAEALFRVALARLEKGDLDASRASLDRLLAQPTDDRAWGSAGRAAYFRARVAQLAGDAADAKTRYAGLVADQPLAFYMLLAYARLRAMDDPAARAAVQAAVAREATAPFLAHEHPELATPAFDRFTRLLEVGEIDSARREASGAGLVADTVDPDVCWTVALMYDRAGAPDLGHSFARSRLVDYRSHWPAGRWRLPWQVAFPRPWDDVVGAESSAAGIPAPLTWAIMREESAFNPDAKSGANAIGLMQLVGGTARLLAKGTPTPVDDFSLRRPEISIALGSKLLGQLRSSFSTNPALAIAAYNSGSGAVRRWLGERGGDDFDVFVERIPYDETRNYLKRVLASEAAYAYLYAPRVLDELLTLPPRASGHAAGATP
ncbi:MAG TPA: transglycosylase SLT domain-containing protein [Polyangiaceae bacterium]